jgi:hypothetical protein
LCGRMFAQWLQYLEVMRLLEEEEQRRQGATLRVSSCFSVCLVSGVVERVVKRNDDRTRARIHIPPHTHIHTSGVVERVVKRMLNKSLSTCLLLWVEAVSEIKSERAEEAHKAVDAAREALEAELDSRKHQVCVCVCARACRSRSFARVGVTVVLATHMSR